MDNTIVEKVILNNLIETKKLQEIWHKKTGLKAWDEDVLSGIPFPTIAILRLKEIPHWNMVFYTGGYVDDENVLTFKQFLNKYAPVSKHVKQIKFESFENFLINEEYKVKIENNIIEARYDKLKASIFFKIKNNLVFLDNIVGEYEPGEFNKEFRKLYDFDFDGLLKLFLKVREKTKFKLFDTSYSDWIEQLRNLMEKANSKNLRTSKYVKQLKFESLKGII